MFGKTIDGKTIDRCGVTKPSASKNFFITMNLTHAELELMDEECQLAWAIAASSEGVIQERSDVRAAHACSVFGCDNDDFAHPACLHPICHGCLQQLKRSQAAATVPCPTCRATLQFPSAEVPSAAARKKRCRRDAKTRATSTLVFVRAHYRRTPCFKQTKQK